MDALRTRAGTLLAAAALATTFLGGQALEGDRDPTCYVWLAIAAFVITAGLTIVVLLPWTFDFFMDPAELVNDYIDSDPKATMEIMLRDLALHYDTAYSNNVDTVNRLQLAFRAAAILLGVEVLAWLPAL